MSALTRRGLLIGNASSDFNHEDLNAFGPVTAAGFDFTPLFEDTILSLLPSALLLLCLPYRVISLHSQKPKVSPGGFLRESKGAFLTIFALVHLALLILHIISPSLRTVTTVAASALAFVASIGLCLLSSLEHSRSIRPSPIINGYVLLTLLFDVARVRTLFLHSGSRLIASCFTGMIGVKVMVLLAEATEKRSILLAPYRGLSPEETSGIYSKSFFFWLNHLLKSGCRRVLHSDDLYPVDSDMTAVVLQQKMKRAWARVSPNSRRALFWAVLRANLRPLLHCIIPSFFHIGFRYAQPFLIARIISFSDDKSQPDSVGWALTGAFFLVLLGVAVSNGVYYHMIYRLVTNVRGSLVSIIYAKTVDLSITALDESAAVTLMSSDVESICRGFEDINHVWSVPIEFTIALYLLVRQVGVASVATAALALFSTVSIMSASKLTERAQGIWMQSIQTRVDATVNVLGSMKSVKMLGLTGWLTEVVQGLRVEELKEARLFRKLFILQAFLSNNLIILSPFVTLTIGELGSKDGSSLSANTAYTTLTLIWLIATPINLFIRSIPSVITAIASLDRIQEFLRSDGRHDHRIFLTESEQKQKDCSTLNEIQLTDLSSSTQASPLGVIIARNSSFSWSQDAGFSVHDVNLSIQKGQICLIIGPTGCGKSTLLKGILGETPSSKGFLYISCQEAAFVDQTPWTRNTSFRNNILGASAYDEEWYNEVVRACALDQDAAILPNGHLTKVGSSGISLSGGQRQRLSLARALYARKDLVILDDVFSGLDADTEDRIFAELFSRQGLFRRLGTTVLLVTHAVHRLSYADHIIAMSSDGSIAEQGRLEDLEAGGGYVTLLKVRYRTDASDSDSPDQRKQASNTASTKLEVANIDTMEEELARQSGDLSLYGYYLGSVHWASTAFWATCFILLGVANVMGQYLVNFWTSALKKNGSSVNGLYLGIYAALTIPQVVGLIGGCYHYILYFSSQSAQTLHSRLLKAVMNAPLSFFTSVDIGTTANRFSQDMTLIDNDLPYAILDFVISLSGGLMSAVLMCISARYFAAVMPAVFLFMWVLQKFYLRTSRQVRLLDLEAKSPLFSQFIESLSGLVTIRAFGWASIFEDEGLALLDTSQKPFYLLYCIQRWLELALGLAVAVLGAILMILVVKLRGDLGAGYVGLAVLNVITFSQSLSAVIQTWTRLETSIGAVARIRDFANNTASENRPGEDEGPVASNDNLSHWPSKGKIEFRNVYASYGIGEDQIHVLRDINLTIEPGQKVGVCGRSGSGKSSLLASLFRILEIDHRSQILVDGVDIARIPRETTRMALNALPQEPFFIHGTVRVNMDPRATKGTDQIEWALRRVELWEVIEAKGGLGALMDVNFFSHGQRQLFCLARALLNESTVIVLDEVSSNVDVVSDALMQRIVREEFAHCTVLAVAHRLDTIIDFDRIAVIHEGELAEFDTPDALLSRDSAFKELYTS